jgi:hypothetical protein
MPDLGSLFDQHVASEFQAKDAKATMETMVDHPTVIHIPVLTGGRDAPNSLRSTEIRSYRHGQKTRRSNRSPGRLARQAQSTN